MKTRKVLKTLGVQNYWTIANLIRAGAIRAPRKDEANEYDWSDADVAAACEALKARAQRRKGKAG